MGKEISEQVINIMQKTVAWHGGGGAEEIIKNGMILYKFRRLNLCDLLMN